MMKVQSFGVIAQLVEHLLCKQGVVSSSLIGSTKKTGKGDENPLSVLINNRYCVIKGVKKNGESSGT